MNSGRDDLYRKPAILQLFALMHCSTAVLGTVAVHVCCVLMVWSPHPADRWCLPDMQQCEAKAAQS